MGWKGEEITGVILKERIKEIRYEGYWNIVGWTDQKRFHAGKITKLAKTL